jgi:hypothetical protein
MRIFWELVGWAFGYKKPKRVKKLKSEIIDMNVRLTWELPTVTPRQLPIQHVRVEFRADASLPWTTQDTVLPEAIQELLFVDVAPGEFFYRVVVVDTANVEDEKPAETSVVVPFDAPSSVLNLVATLE